MVVFLGNGLWFLKKTPQIKMWRASKAYTPTENRSFFINLIKMHWNPVIHPAFLFFISFSLVLPSGLLRSLLTAPFLTFFVLILLFCFSFHFNPPTFSSSCPISSFSHSNHLHFHFLKAFKHLMSSYFVSSICSTSTWYCFFPQDSNLLLI